MLQSIEQDALYPVVLPILEKMGYSVVELRSHRVRDTLHVNLVIYSAKGVSIEDCSEVYRTIFPRMQVVGDDRDLHLEVSSPGLTRNLKTSDEFAIFAERTVRLLVGEDVDWVSGKIVNADDEAVVLETSTGRRRVTYDTIRKAKLDIAEEAGK